MRALCLLLIPLLALAFSGCIDPGYEEDPAADVPEGWEGTGLPFSHYARCDSSYALYASECDSEAIAAIPLDAVPVGALCMDAYKTHKVYADPQTERVVLEFFTQAEADYQTGVFYQPTRGNSMFGVGRSLHQWTFDEMTRFVALEMDPAIYLYGTHHFIRHAGVSVEGTGAAAGKAFSVDWLVLQSGGIEPVYELADSAEHGHFKGPTPIQLVGRDFTVKIDHADLAPDAGTSTHGGRGC